MSTLGERLQNAMTATNKIDRKGLAKAVGISLQALGMVLNGETKALTAENCSKAARYLGVSTDWLAAEHGAMFVSDGQTIQQTTNDHNTNDITHVIDRLSNRLEKLDPEVRREIASIFSIYAVSLRATTKADLIAAINQGEPPKFLKKA